jgi:hypothetical protein
MLSTNSMRGSQRPTPSIDASFSKRPTHLGAGCFLVISVTLAICANLISAQSTTESRTHLSVQLVSPEGKPLERQSLKMNIVTEGYPDALWRHFPFFADLKGKVVIESLLPGRHRFIVNQEWTTPTLLEFDVPPQGLTTTATVLPPDFPSGRPDLLNVDVALRTKIGDKWPTLLDVTVTNNTDQPYTLTATDLQ